MAKAPAKKAASKAIAPRVTGTDMATIDSQLAAESLKGQLQTGGSNRIKVLAKGAFEVEGVEHEELQMVVIDGAFRKQFFIDNYDKENITPPDCYAIGRPMSAGGDTPNTTIPEEDSPDKQADKCAVCPQNVFGSKGRGKACQDRRWLVVNLVDDEGSHLNPSAPLYLLDLSPTNIKPFDSMAGYIEKTLGGSPLKAIVTARAVNVGTYANVTWHDPIPNPDYAVAFMRRAEAADILAKRPDFEAAAAKAAQAPAARRGAQPARRGAAAPARAPARGR